MFVVKKPKPIKVQCKFCETIVKIKANDWETVYRQPITGDEDVYYVRCPYCRNKINFKLDEKRG